MEFTRNAVVISMPVSPCRQQTYNLAAELLPDANRKSVR